jgi:hypothetical protein
LPVLALGLGGSDCTLAFAMTAGFVGCELVLDIKYLERAMAVAAGALDLVSFGWQ